MIVLGDQSPLSGGLLRWLAVEKELGKEEEILYFLQDADNPWRQEGIPDIRIKKGWTNYWSLASKYPWSFQTPGIKRERVDRIIQCLGAPRGLHYLRGPKTDRTIYSEFAENEEVQKLFCQLIKEEVDWANQLASFLDKSGNNELKVNRAKQALRLLFYQVPSILGLGKIQSLVELFQQNPPLLLQELPSTFFWCLDKQGYRRTCLATKVQAKNKNLTLVPKALALPLEFAIRGWTFVYSNIDYLPKVAELRDEYLPGLEIETIKANFNWTLNDDPLNGGLERFKQRKEIRGERPLLPSRQEIAQIQDYWQQHPTPISWLTLGGELNYNLERQTF